MASSAFGLVCIVMVISTVMAQDPFYQDSPPPPPYQNWNQMTPPPPYQNWNQAPPPPYQNWNQAPPPPYQNWQPPPPGQGYNYQQRIEQELPLNREPITLTLFTNRTYSRGFGGYNGNNNPSPQLGSRGVWLKSLDSNTQASLVLNATGDNCWIEVQSGLNNPNSLTTWKSPCVQATFIPSYNSNTTSCTVKITQIGELQIISMNRVGWTTSTANRNVRALQLTNSGSLQLVDYGNFSIWRHFDILSTPYCSGYGYYATGPTVAGAAGLTGYPNGASPASLPAFIATIVFALLSMALH